MAHRRDDFPDLQAVAVHGVVSANALDGVGVGGSMRRRLVREGTLTLVRHGIYAIGQPTGTWQQRAAIVLASAGEDAVLARSGAARSWALDGFVARPGDRPLVTATPVNIPREASRRPADVYRVRELEAPMSRQGLPVTGINQTLIELGAALPIATSPGGHLLTAADQVELAVESALRLGYTTVAELTEVLGSCGGRRAGIAVLQEVLDRRPFEIACTESWLETRAVQVLRYAGIDDVDRQVTVYDRRGVRIGRVDLRVGRVIIECDGRQFHADFEKDRVRWAALHSIGYLVLPASFMLIEFQTTEFLRSLADLQARASHA